MSGLKGLIDLVGKETFNGRLLSLGRRFLSAGKIPVVSRLLINYDPMFPNRTWSSVLWRLFGRVEIFRDTPTDSRDNFDVLKS